MTSTEQRTKEIEYLLQYAHIHFQKIARHRSFIEKISIRVENLADELHGEGRLIPNEAVMKILNSMCVTVFDISANNKRSNPNDPDIEFDYMNILHSLVKSRKFFMFPNLPITHLED